MRTKKYLLSLADFLSSNIREPFNQFFDFRRIFEPVPEVSHETGYIWGFHPVRKVVVHPEPIFFVIDKSCFFKYLQMLGNAGLRYLKGLPDLADAHHPVLEHLNDLDPVWIGQGFRNLDEISQ
jgi:hypothetical protein